MYILLRKGYPLSTYIETIVIAIEAAIILCLVEYYQTQQKITTTTTTTTTITINFIQ